MGKDGTARSWGWEWVGMVNRTCQTEKSGPPRKVDWFLRNFSGWTEPIHSVLDRNFQKFCLNGSRPLYFPSDPLFPQELKLLNVDSDRQASLPNASVQFLAPNEQLFTIGHFRVLLCPLCFKTSLSAKPFKWKRVLYAVSFSYKSKLLSLE